MWAKVFATAVLLAIFLETPHLTYAQRQDKVAERNGYQYSRGYYRLNRNNMGDNNNNNFGVYSVRGGFRARGRQLRNNPIRRRVRI